MSAMSNRKLAHVHSHIRYTDFWGVSVNADLNPLRRFWVWLTVVGWEWPRNWLVNRHKIR